MLLASDALSLQWFPEDFTNALELEIPWALLDGERDSVWLTVLSAQTDEDASDNDAATYIPANLAYRYDALDDGRSVVPCDPVAGIYNERAQAFDLYNGTIDGYAVALDVVGMRLGRSQRWQPTGGYYERIFQSHPSISHEDPLALGYAEVVGAADIFIGVNAVDYSGYPDCRPEYIAAFEKLANLATKAGVEGTLEFKIHTDRKSTTS